MELIVSQEVICGSDACGLCHIVAGEYWVDINGCGEVPGVFDFEIENMQWGMCSFLECDELVSCLELNGCFFKLESLVDYFEDVGFSIITGRINDCVSLFIGLCV